jgi:hypothetical protein
VRIYDVMKELRINFKRFDKEICERILDPECVFEYSHKETSNV